MLVLLSPAKTLDFENARVIQPQTQPDFTIQAQELVSILKTRSVADLMKLMNISSKLAELNFERFLNWQPNPESADAKQAICAFKGDVYMGLDVKDWNQDDFMFAQDHIRILSGLYGVLRPLDVISPYRLEMGTDLRTKKGKTLYKFWGNRITEALNSQLKSLGEPFLINLASNEYYKSVVPSKLKTTTIITPVFKVFKNGEYKQISFFAKKARGMMSRYMVKNQLTRPEQLMNFSEGGYHYNDRLSKENQWVFTHD